MSLTLDDAPGMTSDLRMRSRQFSALPGISRADVPPVCPGKVVPSQKRTKGKRGKIFRYDYLSSMRYPSMRASGVGDGHHELWG